MTGTITRYNKKTVTVITDSGEHWNVAPNLLSRIESSSAASRRDDIRIVTIPNRPSSK